MLKNPLYIYGPRDVYIPGSIHFGEFMLDRMWMFKDRVAFINGVTGESITYKELAQKAINLAVSLTRMGVKKGDVVAISSENRIEFFVTAIAIMFTGAIFTTINMTYSKDELEHVLNISKPNYMFCSPTAYKELSKYIKSLRYIRNIIVYGDNAPPSTILFNDLVSEDVNPEDFEAVEVHGQTDTLMILYSSGTSGLPKGVMLTHLNAFFAARVVINEDPNFIPTVLTIAPWFHAMGMMGTLTSVINGRQIVFLARFDPQQYLEAIQKYKVHGATVAPPVVVWLSKTPLLASYDVTSLEYIYSGAAPLDLEVINMVRKRFPNLKGIYQGYGLTETSLAVTREELTDPITGGVGKVQCGVILKVVDIDTRKALGANQPGEICVKGGIVMKGYIGRNSNEDFDEEGFYKTGDIGYYDDARQFFIVDRLKELIKYKGYQVPPAEIEAVLLRHPGVLDCGVVGEPRRGPGEVPVAFVVKKPGVEVTEKEIVDFVASALSNQKHLRGGVRFIDQIPKNPSGKILRRELRSMLKKSKSKL